MQPFGVAFEVFKEAPDTEQTMQYPIAQLEDSHELWQKALGRTNAYTYEQNRLLRRAQQSEVVDLVDGAAPDLSDIDELFHQSGTGSHMLEIEFIGDEAGPVVYLNRNNVQSKYWVWKHRITGYSFRRFMNPGGKSFETGRLSKCLREIREHQNPVAYARAQHILVLNKCDGPQCFEMETPMSLDRKDLVAQQVCSIFYYIDFDFINLTPRLNFFVVSHLGQGSPICC